LGIHLALRAQGGQISIRSPLFQVLPSKCVLLLVSLLLALPALAGTHTITKDDVRETQPGRILSEHNKKIRSLKKSAAHPGVSEATRKALSARISEIRNSESYQQAVAQLEPLVAREVSCHGDLCNRAGWWREVIERLVANPGARECYSSRSGATVCQPGRPSPEQLAQQQDTPPPAVTKPADAPSSSQPPVPAGLPGLGLCLCVDESGRGYNPAMGHPGCDVPPVFRTPCD